MPFTGSHPAAVLPLLRTPLPTSALVAGSIAPDVPYYLPFELPWGTHTALAVVTVDLLVAALTWALWHALLAPAAVSAAPAGVRGRLAGVPLGLRRRLRSVRAGVLITAALVVGAAVHVLIDEFTHRGRWGAENLAVLAGDWGPLPAVRWLDYAGTVLGGAVLLAWLALWWRRTRAVPAPARPRWWLPWAGLVAAGLVGGLSAVGGAPDLRSAAVAAAFRGGGVVLAAAVVLALADRARRDRRPAGADGRRDGRVAPPMGQSGGPERCQAEGRRQSVDDGEEGAVRSDVETLLSRTLARYERVLANVADGIYGLDASGRVEFVNPAAERITGHPAEGQLGHDQHAVIHGRRPDGSPYPKEECPVWHALQTGRTVAADSEVFWRRDGSPVPVELIAVPTVEDGAVTGVVVSFRDLTDRLAARRQAAELRRLTERAAAQRALSDRLQRALLTPPPEPDHLQVAVRYRPAAHEAWVGGDWYDAFLQPDGATMLVIGDVVGHDSDAAAAMGQLRGLLRALAYDNDEPPAATLTRAEHAARGLAVSTLATVVLARIERHPDVPVTGTRVLRWSNAGHLPPVVLAADGTTTLLETRPDLMLGVDPDAPRADHTTELADGSTLLLVTDGLVERRDSDLDAGLDAMREALRDLGETPLEELCDTLLTRMLPVDGADDVAIVAVRAHPEDRPRPPEAGPNRLPPGVD